MKTKLPCPVCRLDFVVEDPEAGENYVCTICGAWIELLQLTPEVKTQKVPQLPRDEIHQRVDRYAELRGYVFSEDKNTVMEGLMGKHELFGDFYCPCRIDNLPEFICPCEETRMNRVKKTGCCRCGLFYRDRDSLPQE